MRGLRVEAGSVDGADASGKRRGEEGNNELMMDGRGMCVKASADNWVRLALRHGKILPLDRGARGRWTRIEPDVAGMGRMCARLGLDPGLDPRIGPY